MSRLAVIGGILTIAIADAFSDSLGIHLSEESDNTKSEKEIWYATIYTFISKFFFAIQFLVPVLLIDLYHAIIASIVWGLLLIGVLSYYIAKTQKGKAWKVIFEHEAIAVVVIAVTYYVGIFINHRFG